MKTIIRQEDLISSIADAFQFISYYHPRDFIKAMAAAYQREKSPAAQDAIRQILVNSRLAAIGHRPLCQDTGIAIVFLKIGMDVQWDASMSVLEMVNEGVRRAYTDKDNPLRASIVGDPAGSRFNTKDNTPAVVHMDVVLGNKISVKLAAKGFGSENKARLGMLNPSDDPIEWILAQIPSMGGDWCPPGILGVGIGGSPEKAMLMAKESLLDPINIHELQSTGAKTRAEELRIELYRRINASGVGAQGLGGLTTVLDVKVRDYPTHAASLPVAIIPNCAATRHIEFELDGSGPAVFEPPDLDDWPVISAVSDSNSKRVNLDTLSKADTKAWRVGDRLLLSGTLLTARDAAHKRLVEMLNRGEKPPVNFDDRFVYYVGPVDPVRDEIVGPAGPTTSRRMDKFMETMFSKTGMLGSVGKSERGDNAVNTFKMHSAIHLIAVGGAAYLISKSIRASRPVAFNDLGMEAIYEFKVEDMPVTVAIDASGNSIHQIGPAKWRNTIGNIPVVSAKPM